MAPPMERLVETAFLAKLAASKTKGKGNAPAGGGKATGKGKAKGKGKSPAEPSKEELATRREQRLAALKQRKRPQNCERNRRP